MRAGHVAILVFTIASCTATPPVVAAATPSPTREPGTIAVTALLDLCGSRGPKGDAQRGAMQQFVDAQRGSPRVKLHVVDVAGSDAKLLLELKRSADTGDADAIVVGVPAIADETLIAAVALLGRPVLFTLPLAEPSGPGAPCMFLLAPPPAPAAPPLAPALPPPSTPPP